ncbi:MAG TPA: hypothetical protein VHT51_18175, partial [Micropepsaceae bacterium]|nr:hypothetical protein [Micropepsaceae bacterium]
VPARRAIQKRRHPRAGCRLGLESTVSAASGVSSHRLDSRHMIEIWVQEGGVHALRCAFRPGSRALAGASVVAPADNQTGQGFGLTNGVARTTLANAIQRQIQRSSFQLRMICNKAGGIEWHLSLIQRLTATIGNPEPAT